MRLCDLLVVGGGLWLLYRWAQRKQAASQVAAPANVPPGSRPTGRVERTTSGGPPGSERVGWAPADWLEIILPSGERTWVPMKDAKK